MSDDMVKYYRDRAKEYEEIYEWRDPSRQEEQDLMETEIKKAFEGRYVLDIGCGTGYWTERISETAARLVGIDVNETVLEIARNKRYSCPAEFQIMDAYDMNFQPESFTGVLASFWLSHVNWDDLYDWLDHMHFFVKPGAMILIADNNYIEGVGGKMVRKEDDRNTYKLRTLNDGSQHLIVKNYYTPDELLEIFGKYSEGVTDKNLFYGKCFWGISYIFNPSLGA